MNPQNGTLVTLLTNADIACTNATEVVYYGQALPLIFMAAWLVAFSDIFYLYSGGAAIIRIFAEYSVDGVTWTPFAADLYNTTAISTTPGLAHGTQNTTVADYGPLVRFNVGIKSTTAVASSARISAVVNVHFF